ncbi:UNVERIFIED_CONTAM: hypothetical protein GTU68_026771 [Idotea baltica]|nr:hypothetical protein [Idotea baltica]
MKLEEVYKCLRLFLLLIALLATPSKEEAKSPRVVTTKYGKLRGTIRPLPYKNLKPVEVFLGIPYATPPIGSNRFSPTRSPNSWSGERIASQYGPVCPQRFPDIGYDAAQEKMPESYIKHMEKLHNYLSNQAEDCLYLNIYVPSLGKYYQIE